MAMRFRDASRSQRHEWRHALCPRRWRCGRFDELARWAVRGSIIAPRIARSRTSTSWVRPGVARSPARRERGRRCGLQVDTLRQRDAPAAQGAGLNTCIVTRTGSSAFDAEGLGLTDAYRSEQSGWYVQGVYPVPAALACGLALRRARLRFAAHRARHVGRALAGNLSRSCVSADPERISIMVDWNPERVLPLARAIRLG